MPSPLTLPKRAALLALPLLLLLTGCGTDRVRFFAPPPERMTAIPAPVIPPATTPCSFDPAHMCPTDEETAGVIAAYDDALAKANAELEWLRNFFASVPTQPKS